MANLPAEAVSQDVLHFARRATIARFHAAVLSVFVGRCQNCEFSLGALAERLHKTAADVGEILDQPEKWTLDTVSDLMLAMGCEPSIQIRELLFTGQQQPPPTQEAAYG